MFIVFLIIQETPKPIESNEWWWTLSTKCVSIDKQDVLPNNSSCTEAVLILQKKKLEQMPMLDNHGKLKGFVSLNKLMSYLISGEVKYEDPASKVLIIDYPTIHKNTKLGKVSRLLQKSSYAVILDEDKNEAFAGIITQLDLFNFINHKHENHHRNNSENLSIL